MTQHLTILETPCNQCSLRNESWLGFKGTNYSLEQYATNWQRTWTAAGEHNDVNRL